MDEPEIIVKWEALGAEFCITRDGDIFEVHQLMHDSLRKPAWERIATAYPHKNIDDCHPSYTESSALIALVLSMLDERSPRA